MMLPLVGSGSDRKEEQSRSVAHLENHCPVLLFESSRLTGKQTVRLLFTESRGTSPRRRLCRKPAAVHRDLRTWVPLARSGLNSSALPSALFLDNSSW